MYDLFDTWRGNQTTLAFSSENAYASIMDEALISKQLALFYVFGIIAAAFIVRVARTIQQRRKNKKKDFF